MREMFGFVKRLFAKKPAPLKCPYCGGTGWYAGPSGGLSTNLMCGNTDCEHWFNYHQDFAPMDDLHQIGQDRTPERVNPDWRVVE